MFTFRLSYLGWGYPPPPSVDFLIAKLFPVFAAEESIGLQSVHLQLKKV